MGSTGGPRPKGSRRWYVSAVLGALGVLVASELLARSVLAVSDAPILRWHDYSSQLKIDQLDQLAQVDVVIVGTSMAQQDLVPADISRALDGRSVYNAGLNGGVPVVIEPWLLDQVVPRLQPKLVIWGLSGLDLSASYGDATKNAYDEALSTRGGTLAHLDRAASSVSELIAARAVLRDLDALVGDKAKENKQRLSEAEDSLGSDGERTNFGLAIDAGRRSEVERRLTDFALDREDLAAIVRTVSQLEDAGIEVVFVSLPVPERFTVLYPEGQSQHQVVTGAVEALGAELAVPVVAGSIPNGDQDFVDFTHLNEEAAKAFSDDIGRLVQAATDD